MDSIDVKIMLEQVHKASQYLATFGISFADKQPDDSHTNLAWNDDNKSLISRKVNGIQLGLNVPKFRLEWIEEGEVVERFPLADQIHGDIVDWIIANAESALMNDAYEFELHYELPYGNWRDSLRYDLISKPALQELSNYLDKGNAACLDFLSENNLNSEVRVWPHHFDVGFYTEINKSKNIFLGGGQAIPDAIVDDMYFYATGWENGDSIDTTGFQELKKGNWYPELNGAGIPSTGISKKDAVTFFNEALEKFN